MPIVVQKYGGTSVGDTDRISAIADRIVRAREQGQDVVVVVSAMGRTTDDLLEKASDITITPEPRSSTCSSPPANGSRCRSSRSP